MNVTWTDVNSVQEAGEFPFRDGTIFVNFAEVTIWKQNPEAKFQLMRKHPIQGQPKYVLGRQIEEAQPSPADDILLYRSDNGDAWFLTRYSGSNAQAVMHRPNPQSGGRVSYTKVDEFLKQGGNGPEHQALRQKIEATRSAAQKQL